MKVFSKQDKHSKVFFISLLALTSLIIVSASNSEVLACSRSGNSGGPNPDTGGALDGNYQFVKTDSSGTVLAVSYGTNTVGLLHLEAMSGAITELGETCKLEAR